jgi:steroid 5-alpha reductase family enzyme
MTPLIGWAITAPVFLLLWLRQVRTRNATSVDAAWALSIALLVGAYAFTSDAALSLRVLVAGGAGAWSVRLAWHLWFHRVLKETSEDGRYAAMRETWADRAQIGMFLTYQIQAGLAVLFSLPAWGVLQHAPEPNVAIYGAAIAIWLISIGGESLADGQLAKWRRDPVNRGKTCRAGLWGWSRHPNYFFEWVHWWAYVVLAPTSLLAWMGPPLMLLFLFRLTGIPWTEKQALKSRGDDYRRYQEDVSVFVPWPPKQRTRNSETAPPDGSKLEVGS